jgi:hypothetical protein
MSVLLTVKNIFATKLLGIVPWSSVAVTNSTGQELYADIETPKGHRYKLAVKTSYSAPPLGAVTLSDGTDPKNPSELVHGQNQDATWHRVTEYIKAKEAGSSAAEAAKVATVIPEHLQIAVKPAETDDVEIPVPPMVYFIAGRGEFYRNGPALVTRRNPDGTLNITVFADGSEQFYVQNVQPRSDDLPNHCYVAYGRMGEAALLASIKQMIADVLDVTKFDCSEAVNEALQEALPGIVASVKADIGDGGGINDGEPVTRAEIEAQIGIHDAMLGVKPRADDDDPAELTLEELERLTAPDPAPQA